MAVSLHAGKSMRCKLGRYAMRKRHYRNKDDFIIKLVSCIITTSSYAWSCIGQAKGDGETTFHVDASFVFQLFMGARILLDR